MMIKNSIVPLTELQSSSAGMGEPAATITISISQSGWFGAILSKRH